MTCDQLLKAMNDYVDGHLDPALCEHFAHHLAQCNPCQVVVDNIRKTIQLYKDGQPFDLPPEFSKQLHSRLRQLWPPKPTSPG